MEAWIGRLGYFGVFVGAFVEGETTILLAGMLAKLGYLQLEKVVFFAFAGTLLGDCTFFLLGRYLGNRVVERFSFLRSRKALAGKIVDHFGHLIILMMRFMAGFRSPILLLLGCTPIKPGRFLVVDALIVFAWTVVVSFAGYAFANVAYLFVTDVHGYEKLFVPAAAIIAVSAILVYRHIIKKKEEELYGD